MDKVNYVVQGIAVYVEAMANAHHCSNELVWLRLAHECDKKLDELRGIDSPEVTPE